MGKWIQVKGANIGITYTGGWCLKAVQDAFGTAHVYPTAYDDWISGENGKGNHDGEQPPAGVQVPIYLKLGTVPAGDIAISLGDGRVAAAAQGGTHVGLYIYSSMQSYINDYGRANGGATYLGWSEGTGNTRVVAYQPDITTQDVTQSDPIAFTTENQDNATILVGQSQSLQAGVNGSHTVVTRITYSDGKETGRTVISDVIVPAVPHIVAIGTKPVPVEPPVPPVVTPPVEPPTPPVVNPIPPAPIKPVSNISIFQLIIQFIINLFKRNK